MITWRKEMETDETVCLECNHRAMLSACEHPLSGFAGGAGDACDERGLREYPNSALTMSIS